MEKFAIYPGRVEGAGSPRIHLIEPGSTYGLNKTAGLEGTPSSEHLPEVIELVESIKPKPDRLYLLNSALGAFERVGLNLRGDGFDIRALTRKPKGWDEIPVWDIEARRERANEVEPVDGWGPLSWGFPTFYNAYKFQHHQNKDPNRAYGTILGAFWDARMDRVILVSELRKDWCTERGAEDLYNRVAAGEFPDTSMGSRVPFDVCTICGHLARTPAEYCKHVRRDASPPFGMKALLADGRRCGVLNPYPRFFDDSYVFMGAEKSAKTMTNLTALLKGEREPSDRIFIFTAPNKVADNPPSIEDKLVDKALSIGATPTTVKTPIGERLARAVDGFPALTEKERRALAFFKNRLLAEEALSLGKLTSAQARLVEQVERLTLMRELALSVDDYGYIRELLNRRIEAASQKTASTKWAEFLKKIPEPTEGQRAILGEHQKRLHPLNKESLRFIAEKPKERVKAAAFLGIILRPEEFQYVMLEGASSGLGEAHQSSVFAPSPLNWEKEAAWEEQGVDPQEVVELRNHFGDGLYLHSILPEAVCSRSSENSASWLSGIKVAEVNDDLQNELSSLYNEYRCGLLNSDFSLGRIPSRPIPFADIREAIKLASSADEISLYLRIAYWPSLNVI